MFFAMQMNNTYTTYVALHETCKFKMQKVEGLLFLSNMLCYDELSS